MKKILIIVALIIISTCLFAQDVKISQGKLQIDGLLWLQYIYTQTRTFDFTYDITDTVTFSSFKRRNAFVGLTANLNSWATGRIYFDVADITGKPAYDLYALLNPNSNLSFIIGQFKLPLGVEMLTKTANLELVEYSLIGRTLRAPEGTRDIGMQIAYQHPSTDIAIAIVNGNGRNIAQDIDKNKCIAARAILKPFQKTKTFIGVNYYSGEYDLVNDFSRIGAELSFYDKPIALTAELLFTKDNTLKGIGYYGQISYSRIWLQPVLRYSSFKYENSNWDNEIVVGLNFRPLSDNFKIMLNYKFERTYLFESDIKQNGLLAQLQFAF